MTIHFLPDTYTRATQTTVIVPVTGVPDLTDPSNGRTVIPARVELIVTRFEGTPDGGRQSTYVAVIGPRRLKSGAPGREITTTGWQNERNKSWRGTVAERPDWLSKLVTEHQPQEAAAPATEDGAL